MLRTEQSALRPVWSLSHTALTRAVAAYLRRGCAASVYLRGSFASGEPVYGLSDVDLVIVAAADPARPGAVRDAIRQRWQRLSRRLPTLGSLISVAVYEEAELLNAASASWLTYGLEGRQKGRSVHLDRQTLHDELGLGIRPELYGPTRGWQLLAGRDRRPALPPPSGQQRWLAAWLELQWWWRLAFVAVTEPAAPWAPYLCMKLVAEPARIWLWVARGEQVREPREALEQTARRLPEEESVLRMALSLHRRLPRSPDPPFGQVLPFLVRMSSRLARRLEDESGDDAEVQLVWGDEDELPGPEQTRFPLLDWRALTEPGRPPDEALVLVDGDAGDPETLARAAATDFGGAYPAFQADGLLVLPSANLWGHSVLRAVQCAATDPVSFALAERSTVARFTDLPGWSASDSARRAVAEYRGWLALKGAQAPPTLETLARLFRAARAAVLHESLDAGEPELPLTMAATATRLAEREPAARAAAEEAYANDRACRIEGRRPDPEAIAALRDAVSALPVYANLESVLPPRRGS